MHDLVLSSRQSLLYSYHPRLRPGLLSLRSVLSSRQTGNDDFRLLGESHKALPLPPSRSFLRGYGLSDWVNWMENRWKLTYIHNFSVIILWKINLRNVIPPFHLRNVITLSISTLNKVELVVELGWNYMKFHPNSTPNSTTLIFLIIKTLVTPRWKGGITFRKIIFLEITAENMWNYVKKHHFWGKSALWICVHNGIDIAR